MPQNNGRARKAWRKENADYNAAFWAAQDAKYPAAERPRHTKPYVRTDRPDKEN